MPWWHGQEGGGIRIEEGVEVTLIGVTLGSKVTQDFQIIKEPLLSPKTSGELLLLLTGGQAVGEAALHKVRRGAEVQLVGIQLDLIISITQGHQKLPLVRDAELTLDQVLICLMWHLAPATPVETLRIGCTMTPVFTKTLSCSRECAQDAALGDI